MLKRERDLESDAKTSEPPEGARKRKKAVPKRHPAFNPLVWLLYTFDASVGEDIRREEPDVREALEPTFAEIIRNQKKLELRQIPGKNCSVYCKEPLKKGDILASYDGVVYGTPARVQDQSTSITLSDELTVDCKERFSGRVTGAQFNHCCRGHDGYGSNCEYLIMRSEKPEGGYYRLNVVFIRVLDEEIPAGSELTVDYGPEYFKQNVGENPCMCRGQAPCPLGRTFG